MKRGLKSLVNESKQGALEVLLHNSHGPYHGLPRAAGWGYPEPYTRDLMISSLGMVLAGNQRLTASVHRVLETLAKNQSRLGHIPSLVNDPEDRGASDTTPLFLISLAAFHRATGQPHFLEEAAGKALQWMEYQSPSDRVLVAQQPTSDWRDEQWVPGFGLYVNTLLYCCLRLYGQHERALCLRKLINRFVIKAGHQQRHIHEGLVLQRKPYYALWSYKVHYSQRFDLLGNSLAILSGIASRSRARHLVTWIETECVALRRKRLLAVDLPPNLFPYIQPCDPDWRPRYAEYNQPGQYHNGGVWPFVCSFYIAAMVAAGFRGPAERKLAALTMLVRPAREANVPFGFNEWFRAQDGTPKGQDWQTWSAAMYLYACLCVERGYTPVFDEVRRHCWREPLYKEPDRTLARYTQTN